MEGDKAAVVTARLRIENRRIVEAEWYVARNGDPGLPGANPPNLWDPEALAATPPPERNLAQAQRLPRDAMIGIVNSYFDGITSHDGTVVIARDGCHRYENGRRVTGNRGGGAADDCKSGYAGFNLQNVQGRRVGFVDEEQGFVLGMAVFIRKAGSPVRRNAFSEWFMIKDGRIEDIWTAMYYPDPNLPVPNWPPFDGNFPLPPFTTLVLAIHILGGRWPGLGDHELPVANMATRAPSGVSARSSGPVAPPNVLVESALNVAWSTPPYGSIAETPRSATEPPQNAP
jgi:hypothetical protein